MPRTEGTFGQAKHLLGVLSEAGASTEQFQGLASQAWALRKLLDHGLTLKLVKPGEFERVLTPPGDYWAKLPENPFADEQDEPGEKVHPLRGIVGSNHLTYSAGCYERAFGHHLDDFHVKKVEQQKPELPEGADGYYCWPKLSAIARILNVPDPYVMDYGYCLRHALVRANCYRPVDISDQANGLNADQLRLLPSVANLYREWEKKTPGDYLIAPLQLGGLYAGCSARNARYQMINSAQFPLDPYVVVCLLASDSSLLYREETAIDCPGVEYARYPGDVRTDILTVENSNASPTLHLFDQAAHPPKIRCASGFLPKGMKLKV